jgi:hypothetical protein
VEIGSLLAGSSSDRPRSFRGARTAWTSSESGQTLPCITEVMPAVGMLAGPSLSGQFTSPPAVVARGPNKLDVFGLGGDYAMYHASGDGKTFAQWDRQGGEFETPGTYRFSLDSFEILDTRSVHNDTDSIAVTLTVGARPPQTLTMKTGDVNNGTHNVGLAFAPVNVDLSDFVIFNYLILNSGHADQKEIDDQLTGFAKTLADKGVQAAKDAISKGATALVGAAIGSAVMPLIGTILGMIAGALVGALTGLIFVNCDGPVAAEQVALTGVQLRGDLGRRSSNTPDESSGRQIQRRLRWKFAL